MPSDTQNCSPKPIFKGLTQLFLNGFGTNKLPDGYVKRDEYGPKTKKQDFTELFTTFYILIVLAVLCALAFLLMIAFLVWYCNRNKYKPEQCRCPKVCALLLTSLLLLSIILLALFLFSTFKNLLHLKKLYNKPKRDSSTKNAETMKRVIEILDNDFEKLRNDSINECWNTPSLTDLYPETTKARKSSIANRKIFEDFIETFVEPIFDDTLLYDDIFRMFSRNFSAFYGVSAMGAKYILNNNANQYKNAIFSLDDWEGLYNSAIAIKDLMNFYKDSASSELRRSRVCYQVSKYFNKLASYAKVQKGYLGEKLKSHSLSKDPHIAPPYKFAHIVCVMAIVVLVMFFLVVMCSLCMKGNVMIKALLFIYIILTLLLILMTFVTLYHFFYGVIEYNGFCHRTEESAGKKTFKHVMLTDCTNDQNLYTLLLENNLIRPFSKWIPLNKTIMQDVCERNCRALNMAILQKLQKEVEKFPKKNHFCKFKSVASSWLTPIRLTHVIYNAKLPGLTWMTNDFQGTYFHERVKFSYCNLNLANKAKRFNPTVSKSKFWKCRAAYTIGKDFAASIPSVYAEVKDMCTTTKDKCKYYNDHDISTIRDNVDNYITNAERGLKNALGSCTTIFHMIKAKQNKSCNCETFILNGVWIGGLLFVITLFLALLLLAGLIYKLVKCKDHYRNERHGRREDDSAESILLPPITLPRHVIDTLENDENPRVTYHIKKLN
ncbi:uncharacterized protein LOC105223569 isoform X2 [Bactrocera dorsalis]|uniref:Uncharacterized protein LOC105223569 isoform X2 n=1 Tax=Bactrocera dorsalis TaxID=27457 RepID=A0ABM3IZI5_BACDO|nr:uncharacterized protein LOC105223569 isoform X2 [Bactrocera dorsalis]